MRKKSLSKLLLLALATASITTAMPNANHGVVAEEENTDVVKFSYRYTNIEFFRDVEGGGDWNNISTNNDVVLKFNKFILKNNQLLTNDGFVVEKTYNDGRVEQDIIRDVDYLKFTKEELKNLYVVEIILLERESNKSYNVTISPEVKAHITEKGLNFNDGTYSYMELDEKLYDLDHSEAYREDNTETTKTIRKLVVNYGGNDYGIREIFYPNTEDQTWHIDLMERRKEKVVDTLKETYLSKVINDKSEDITIKFDYKTKERTVITRILEADEVNPEEREEIEILEYSEKADDERIIFAVGGIEYFIKDDFAYFLDKVYVNGKEIDYKNPELYWYHKNGREYFATNFKKKFIEENGKTLRIRREYVKVKNSIKFKVEENSKELLKPTVYNFEIRNEKALDENIGYDIDVLYRGLDPVGNGTLKDKELVKNYRLFYVLPNGVEVEGEFNREWFLGNIHKHLIPEKENTIIIKAVPKKDETKLEDNTKPTPNNPVDTNKPVVPSKPVDTNKPESTINPVVESKNEKHTETESKENKTEVANKDNKKEKVVTIKNPMPKTAVASVSTLTAIVSLAGAFVFRKRNR